MAGILSPTKKSQLYRRRHGMTLPAFLEVRDAGVAGRGIFAAPRPAVELARYWGYRENLDDQF